MTVPNNGGTTNTNRPVSTHPSVTFLVLLVLVEYGSLILLRYVFRSVHGG